MPKGRPPTSAQLAQIQEFASEANADNVLVYRHLMVGDQIVPNRYMFLNKEKTLPVFAGNTKAGATWIFNHNWYDPTQFGTGFDSELVTEPEMALVEKAGKLVMEQVQARHLYGMFYLPKGLGLQGAPYPDTDSVVRAIEMGVLRDTSIGFRIDRYQCNICGNDIRDWENCMHWPGQVYDVDEGTSEQMCIVDAQGGELFEQSSVFAGAYPTAGIMGQATASSGKPTEWEPVPTEELKRLPLDAQVFCTFGSRGGMNFHVPPGTKRLSDGDVQVLTAAGGAPVPKPTGDPEQQGAAAGNADPPAPPPSNEPMAWGTTIEIGGRTIGLVVNTDALAALPDSIDLAAAIPLAATVDTQARIDEANAARDAAEASAHGAVEKATAAEARAETVEQALTAAHEGLRTALALTPDQDPVAEVQRLAPDLTDARTYREHLITEALAMGVRAYGNSFNADTWEKFLRTPGRPLAELQIQAQAFETEAHKRIPSTRLSESPDPPDAPPTPAPVPDSVYRFKR